MPTTLLRRLSDWLLIRRDAGRLRHVDDRLLADMGFSRERLGEQLRGRDAGPVEAGTAPDRVPAPLFPAPLVPRIAAGRPQPGAASAHRQRPRSARRPPLDADSRKCLALGR